MKNIRNIAEIQLLGLIVKRQPTAQMAHLVFADRQPTAKKPKEPFFANAPRL
ncbi:MAG: hypothetical protein LCH44_14155 [Bacteroidetes bacterium]|jgi:hypothetical protein|nr:hypothetical protein [Bacteroidota bacterium]